METTCLWRGFCECCAIQDRKKGLVMPQSLQKAYEDTLLVDDEINNLMQLEEYQNKW